VAMKDARPENPTIRTFFNRQDAEFELKP
jgi:hypothetical protein